MSLFARFLSLTILASAAAAASAQTCVPDTSRLCFQGGDFSATATYQTPGGLGSAVAVQPAGGLPGYFRFNDPLAAEIVPDVFNGCGVNSRFWVFAKAVSNAGWLLTVTDHQSGSQRSYSVPTGEYGVPVADTDAFPCPVLSTPPAEAPEVLGGPMDLFNRRFRVTALLPGDPSFSGIPLQLTRNSGLLAFFNTQNPDVLVKVFYPGNTGFFGVAASWTQIDTTVQVEDLCTLEKRVYHTGTVTSFGDPAAFSANDEDCGLFADGFETAGTSVWTSTVP